MIKKLILLTCLFIPVLAYCQIEKPIKKGNIILGGTGSVYSAKNTLSGAGQSVTKVFTININPTFNYFVIDNLALGATLDLGYLNNNSNKGTEIGFGPNVKYYFNNGILLRSEVAYSTSASDGLRIHGLNLKAGIGYALFINSKISIEPSLLYNASNEKQTFLERELMPGFTQPEYKMDQKYRSILFEIGFHFFL
jgi:hypothetical protein